MILLRNIYYTHTSQSCTYKACVCVTARSCGDLKFKSAWSTSSFSSYNTHKVQQLSVTQRESGQRQREFDRERQCFEEEQERRSVEHAQSVESAVVKFRGREKSMRDQLRERELFLKEHRHFVKVNKQDLVNSRIRHSVYY